MIEEDFHHYPNQQPGGADVMCFPEFVAMLTDLYMGNKNWPYPDQIKRNGPTSDMIVLDFASLDGAHFWAKHYGAQPQLHHGHPTLRVKIVIYDIPDIFGWHLQVSGREPFGA